MMIGYPKHLVFVAIGCLLAGGTRLAGADDAVPVEVDLSRYKADSGVSVTRDGDRLRVSWPSTKGEFGR